MSTFQKQFVNTAESCNGMLKFRSLLLKIVTVLINIEVGQDRYIDKDISCKQLGKFSSVEDDHKLKYMQTF